MLRFGLVGGSGVLVNYAILCLLAATWGLNHLAAAALATEVAILSNFTLNNLWTFRGATPGGSWARRGLRYNVYALGGLVISVAVLAALTYLLHMHYLVANVFAIGAATLWNYAANYRWTWSVAPFTHRTLSSEADRA
jgi:dolichol-phosphate mannosyltransferase